VVDNCVVGAFVVVKVSVYAVPIVPVRVTFEKVTTPELAVLVRHDVPPPTHPSVAPELTDKVTCVALSSATRAPLSSRTRMTGCVAKGPPEGPPTGDVDT
jgi:hypothetical protein